MTNEQIENVENVESNNDLSNDNVLINHDVKNYLDAKILDVKSYDFEEISKIDKKIDLSNNEVEESEIYNKNIVELNEKQLVKGTVVSLNNK